MNIITSPLSVVLWKDPDGPGQTPEEKAIAIRMSITERCAENSRLKENYATALKYLSGVPLPYDCRLPDLETECLEIERHAWRRFVDDLHLREVLGIAARNKLDDQLSEHRRGYGREAPLPPFTVENVWSFFDQTCQNIPSLIREALTEIFNWLTPSQRWTGCKTSNEFMIGEKVVLPGAVSLSYGGKCEVNYNRRAEIDALGNALAMLDGKGVRKTTVGDGADPSECGPYSGVWNTAWREGQIFSDAYLTAKAFKNGNAHVIFKRRDLVDRINQAAADNALQTAGREKTNGFSH